MNETEAYAEVVDFINHLLDIDKNKITPQTHLVDDLKIDGYDADFFMSTFSSEYQIDLTDYNRSEYFHDEDSFFVQLKNALHGKKPPKSKLKEIRICDLIQSLQQHKFPPSREPAS